MNIKITTFPKDREVSFCNEELRRSFKKCEEVKNKLDYFNKQSYCFIATEKDTIVGYLYAYMISQSGELTYHSTVKLETIIVADGYQNHGIATALLETFSYFCHNHNMKMLETDVFYQNEYIRRLYWNLDLRRYCYRMRISFEEEQV